MFAVGSDDLYFPPLADLRTNANTAVLRDQLSEWTGVEQYTIEPARNTLRNAFDVSVRQALLMCFQKQTELSSQRYLFHRQSDRNVQDAIKDTLPYFLGVTGPYEASLRRRFLAARRSLSRAERELATAQQEDVSYDTRVQALVEEARTLGLVESVPETSGIELLRQILAVGMAADDQDEHTLVVSDRGGFLDQRRTLRRRLRQIDEELALVRQVLAEEGRVRSEAEVQADRLGALAWLPDSEPTDESACPVCTQPLRYPDPTVRDLQALEQALTLSLRTSALSRPRRESTILDLEEQRRQIIESLRLNTLAMESVDAAEVALQDAQNLRERRIFLQGRISQEVGRRTHEGVTTQELEREVRVRRDEVAALEQLIERNDIESALWDVLQVIGEDMTVWARRLDLEHSENFIRLEMAGPNVVALTPGGRRPLTNIGSAKNWIGYHLIAHLALHKWFYENDRPVPRFVMFDQPSQGFFPEQVSDAAEIEDADWGPVRQQFMLMRDVVSSLGGGIQVIVCDHANFVDEWFQDCLIGNWRGDDALIPKHWIE
jgi:hypothetical protein